MELPERPLPEPKRETEEDEKELYLLERRTSVRCHDEGGGFLCSNLRKDRKRLYKRDTDHDNVCIQRWSMFRKMIHWFGKDGPLLFETSVYAKIPGVEVKYVPMFCSTYDEAEQMHQIAVERVRTMPLEELAHVYSHTHSKQN